MPDKTNVGVLLRIARPDGTEERTGAGALFRMATGWAIRCRLNEPAGVADDDDVSEIFLVVRDDEIRLNRKGAVRQEQIYRVGEWRPGTIGTPYGTFDAEALTHGIRFSLSRQGGTVEWSYDLRMMNEELGRSSITLDIREENGE